MDKEELAFEKLKKENSLLNEYQINNHDEKRKILALFSPDFYEGYKLPESDYLKDLKDPSSVIESISNLSLDIKVGHTKNKFEESSNTIYIPKIGRSKVCTSITEFKIKEQNYIKVSVDQTKSYAEFLASFLNSSLGLKIRTQCMKGHIPSLSKTSIGEMKVLIPSIKHQKNILNFLNVVNNKKNQLSNLSNSLEALKTEIVSQPSSLSKVSKKFKEITKDVEPSKKVLVSSFKDWINTIPFPLAIILRTYLSLRGNDAARYRVLLKFFEAAVAFITTIYFGAYRENQEYFNLIKEKFKKDGSLNFKNLTFGVWVQTFSLFSLHTREILNKNKKSCITIFSDEDLILPLIISDKRILNVFSAALKIRNQEDAHGSYIDSETAKELNSKLYQLVESFREITGDVWNRFELIKVDLTESFSENEYMHYFSSLTGSDTTFIKKEMNVEYNLYKNNLYLINKNLSKPIKLEKFIQISKPPKNLKNACYFYNKLNQEGKPHFISYHYSNTIQGENTNHLLDLINEISY